MEEGEELQKNTKNIQQIMEIRQRFQIFFFFSSKQVTASFFFLFKHTVQWLLVQSQSYVTITAA